MKSLVVLLLAVCAFVPNSGVGQWARLPTGDIESCIGAPTPGGHQVPCRCTYIEWPLSGGAIDLWNAGCQASYDPPIANCHDNGDCARLGLYGDVPFPQWIPPLEGQEFDSLKDKIFVKVDSNTLEPVDATRISSYHRFQMVSDSGMSDYQISDLTYDGNRIKWADWIWDTTIWEPDTLLRDSTRSMSFTLGTGKKVKFYREFFWRDYHTLQQTASNYYCDDRLDFSVILEDKTTGGRLALIDSFTILASNTRSMPVYYSSRPLIAICEYTVPAQYNGKSAIVRVIPKATGNGKYLFTRKDDFASGLIERASASWLADYLDEHDGGWVPISYKPSADNAAQLTTPEIEVIQNAKSQNIQITIRAVDDRQNIAVSVLNAAGMEMTSNFHIEEQTPSQLSGMLQIQAGPGLYFIVVTSNGKNLSVQKILKEY